MNIKTKLVSCTLGAAMTLGMCAVAPLPALAEPSDSAVTASRPIAVDVAAAQVVSSGFYASGSAFNSAFGVSDAVNNTFYVELSEPLPTGQTIYVNVTVGTTTYSVACLGNGTDTLFYFSFDNPTQIDFYNSGNGWFAGNGGYDGSGLAGQKVSMSISLYNGTFNASAYPASGLALMTEPLEISIPASGSVVTQTYTASVNTSGANASAVLTTDSGYAGETINVPAGTDVTVDITPSDGYQVSSVVATNNDGYSREIPYTNGEGYVLTMPTTDIMISVYTEAIPASLYFYDVRPGSWYYDDVYRAAENGYIHGYRQGYFGPEDLVLRAQVATILFNMSGWSTRDYTGTANFPDVNTGDYFYEAAAWAQINGIISGYDVDGEHLFGPWDNCTREQLMTMIMRYAQFVEGGSFKAISTPEVNQILSAFPDGDKVSGWAREAVAWCVANRVISGVNINGTRWLSPQASITRAETATIAVNYQPTPVSSPIGR